MQTTAERRAQKREYYKANREKIAAYRRTNREALAAQKKEYYKANREARAARIREYHKENREAVSARKKEYRKANREKLVAYREANREAIAARKKRYYITNREAISAHKSEYQRRTWQHSGSGVHRARIQDWRDIFDGFATDAERCIAAHVLMFLADYDSTAKKIVLDSSFDYTYIAEHFDIEEKAA